MSDTPRVDALCAMQLARARDMDYLLSTSRNMVEWNELATALEAQLTAAQEDAERYRFLKTRLSVPGAMYRFLRLNDWSVETDLRDIDKAIDAALRSAEGGKDD